MMISKNPVVSPLHFLEPFTMVMDAATSDEWIASAIQHLKAAGDDLYYHSLNVAALSAHLALFGNMELLDDLGIPIRSLLVGALLHDIGYVTASPAYSPRGKAREDLDPIESYIFNQHIHFGCHHVEQNSDDPIILDIVSKHHELIDGSGYPNGLSGDEIPPHVRIVSLANAISCYFEQIPCSIDSSGESILQKLQELLYQPSVRAKYDLSLAKAFLDNIGTYLHAIMPLHHTLHGFDEQYETPDR